jgi:hypothetical protein
MYSGHFKHELKNSTKQKIPEKKNMKFWGPPNSPTAH